MTIQHRRFVTLICIFMTILFSLFIFPASAKYHESSDLSFVDGNMEDYYSKVDDYINYSLYFANTEDTMDIFIDSTVFIHELLIDVFTMYDSYDNIYIKSVFVNKSTIHTQYDSETNITTTITDYRYVVECAVSSSHECTSDRSFIIRINEMEPIQLMIMDYYERTSQDQEESTRKYSSIFTIIALLMTILIIRFWMLSHKPHMYVRKENEYELIYLGRCVDCQYDEITQKYKYYFKTSSGKDLSGNKLIGIREVYSDLNYYDVMTYGLNVKKFLISAVTSFHMLLPHIILRQIDIPDNVQIFKKELKMDKRGKTAFNKYRFFSHLPMKSFVKKMYDDIYVNSTEKLKKIEYLELEYCRDVLEFYFDVEYDIKEIDKITGKNEIKHKILQNVTYTMVLTILKSKIEENSMKIAFKKADVREFKTIKEAIQHRDSNDTLKSKFIKKELGLSFQISKLSNESLDLYEKLRDMKDNQGSTLRNKLENFVNRADSLENDLPTFLGMVFEGKKLGMGDKDNYKNALTELLKLKNDINTSTRNSTDLEKINRKIDDFEGKFGSVVEKLNMMKLIGDMKANANNNPEITDSLNL